MRETTQLLLGRRWAGHSYNVNTTKKERIMSDNTFATVSRLAAGPAFTRVLRVLGPCLALLMLTQLPAYADHIHHLWYNNIDWQDQDLTAKTNGGTATSGGGVAAFSTPGGQFHVYYVDSTYSHLHQLYYNGHSWSDQDLTGLTGGPTAYPYNVSGFGVGNYQYVYYVGTDNHVHETYYVDNWTDIDLTAGLDANLASPISLVAFSAPNGVIWVFYQDMNTLGDYVFNFNGTVWSYQQITNSGVFGAYCEAVWAVGSKRAATDRIFSARDTSSPANSICCNSAWPEEPLGGLLTLPKR